MELVFVVSFANGGWWWHLASGAHHTPHSHHSRQDAILAHSDHGYPSEDECRRAIEMVKSCWHAPVQLRPRERNDHP